MKRLYPSNSQFPHFVPVLGSLVLIICDKSLNTLLIVSCVFVDVKFMQKKESQSPPVRTHAFLVRALRFFHSLAVLFLIFFLFFFQWSSCKEKENLSETISSTPQIFFFPLGLESFGVLVSLVSTFLLLFFSLLAFFL
jgi:predicted signal transduction protein with EAL and GGDEF domain